MQIQIHDIAAKPDWLGKIAAFLHDASIYERFAYDDATLTFSLPIHRIGYEYRKQTKKLWFFTAWSMPPVPSTLSLAPVRIISTEEGSDAWTGWGEQLVDMGMTAPDEIELITREATVLLRCVDQTVLVLTDTGRPGKIGTHVDFGRLILPPELVSEIVGTSDA